MRRLALFVAGFGLARLLFWRRSPTAQLAPAAAEPQPDPRADALRAKLAEAREAVGERDEFEGAKTPVGEMPSSGRPRMHSAPHEGGALWSLCSAKGA